MKRENLIKARIKKNITGKQLAQEIGITKAMICMIENCHCNPSWKVAQRLERFFGIPASELLAEGEEEKV